jgi:probable rRNA maturation factor
MSLEVSVQFATRKPWVPARNLIALWAYGTLLRKGDSCDLSVRVVGNAESRRLNRQYRRKDKPTNVLAFPASPLTLTLSPETGERGRSSPLALSFAAAERGRSSPLAPRRGERARVRGGFRRTLGDLVICAPVVAREARAQGKSRQAHWAHMIVHGTLHLLGYDHLKPADATRMERREALILQSLGYQNPYVYKER